MKSKKNLIEQLKSLPYFNKATFCQLGNSYGLEDSTMDTYISRYIKSKEIIQLKKGLYITTDFYNNNKNDISYIFYLANVLRGPSYVSSWAALQYYNLTTEIINTITSVSEKVTRDYITKINTFSYHSINKKLFKDYSLVKGKFEFFIATPSKALFDLIYFRTNQLRGIKIEEIDSIVESLRIDIDEMDGKERDNFYKLIRDYIRNE